MRTRPVARARSASARACIGGLMVVTLASIALGPSAFASDSRASFRFPSPVVKTLDHGLKVAVYPIRRLPLVQMELWIPAGSDQDAADGAGMAAITAEMMRMGTTSRDAAKFATEVDSLGGSLVPQTSREGMSITGAFLANDASAGLGLMADMVSNPIFSETELRTVQRRLLLNALQRNLNPESAADDQVWAGAFEGTPVAGPVSGTAQTIARVTVERLRDFYRAHYTPERSVLVVAGDVNPDDVFIVAEDVFSGWTGKSAAPAARRPAPVRPGIRVMDFPDLPATELVIGWQGPPRGSDDEVALAVAGRILGGSADSRLARTVSPQVFARQPRSVAVPLEGGGLFAIASLVANDSAAVAIAGIRDAVRLLATEGPSEEELDTARATLESTYSIQFETLEAIAHHGALAVASGHADWADEGALQRIASVNAAAVQAAVRRWIDFDHVIVVAAGPAARLRPQLAGLMPVQVVAPGSMAAPAPIDTAPAPKPPTRVEQSKGRDLLKRALVAHGGLDRLKKIKDSTIEADAILSLGGRDLKGVFRQVRKDPWRMVYVTRFESFSTEQTLSGNDAWSVASGVVQMMDSVGVAGLRAGFASDPIHLLVWAADPAAQVASRGRETIASRPVDVVEVRYPDGAVRRLGFDAESHRLAAMDQSEPGSGASLGARRLYGDYRLVQGVWWPHREERFLNGERVMLLTVNQALFDTGVDDASFEKPEPELAPPSR
jgi:zinc protease